MAYGVWHADFTKRTQILKQYLEAYYYQQTNQFTH